MTKFYQEFNNGYHAKLLTEYQKEREKKNRRLKSIGINPIFECLDTTITHGKKI